MQNRCQRTKYTLFLSQQALGRTHWSQYPWWPVRLTHSFYYRSTFLIFILIFRHQLLGAWNGHSHKSNKTIGGCSALGVTSQGQFGLVYKANQNTGGIFRTLSTHPDSQHRLVHPIHIKYIPEMRKYWTSLCLSLYFLSLTQMIIYLSSDIHRTYNWWIQPWSLLFTIQWIHK